MILNAEKAYNILDTFWNYFCLPNGFHANGNYKKRFIMNWDYRPVTLEANFCAIDAMQEMFLLDAAGKVTIAPAIPKKWESYSFKLRSKNGVIITAEVKDGKLVSVEMEAYKDADFDLLFDYDDIAKITLKKGEKKTLTF